MMSDWFKFYNDGLDSHGMQYCIDQQPLATSVWLVILSEASKNRSAKIKWADNDFQLIGYSRKINVSPAIFNQCVRLFEHVKYISLRDGCIEVLGWEAMQSDYAKGIDRGYYKKTSKKLASVSEVSTVRREEKRREDSTSTPLPPEVVAVEYGNEKLPYDQVLAFKQTLGAMFGRKPEDSWSNLEEHSLIQVINRPAFTTELEEIKRFKVRVPSDRIRFDWPATLGKLLDLWTGTLDKARTYDSQQTPDRNKGTFNEGKAHLYANVGKLV